MNGIKDNITVWLIIGFVGTATLMGLGGMIYNGANAAELAPVVTGGIGALAALLASTRTSGRREEAVGVKNEPGKPLETKEVSEEPKP